MGRAFGLQLWNIAYRFGGKQLKLSLGAYLAVALKHAREQRDAVKRLGHESILTTFSSYGEVPPNRQAEIMRELAGPKRPVNSNHEIAQRLVEIASQLQS